MGLRFYKPNKAVKGVACHLFFNSKIDDNNKAGSVFLEVISQTGWDETKKSGTFSNGDQGVIKFSPTEVSLFRGCLKEKVALKDLNGGSALYHTSPDADTSIDFLPYVREGNFIGFSMFISRKGKGKNAGKNKDWRVGFTIPEMYLLEEYFRFSLEHIFSGLYSADIKKYKDATSGKTDE
jgi:hypothetical protein